MVKTIKNKKQKKCEGEYDSVVFIQYDIIKSILQSLEKNSRILTILASTSDIN